MNMQAKAGAASVASAADTADQDKHLSIAMGDEAYGIPVLRVKEIIEYEPITPVPMMPDFIRGSINLRGHGVPVADLAIRFGRPPTEVGRRTCIVIVEVRPERGARFDVGLLVDAVNEVRDIGTASIEPPPSFGGVIRTDFMVGMAKLDHGFLILLDVDRILSLEALLQAGAVGASGNAPADAEARRIESDTAAGA